MHVYFHIFGLSIPAYGTMIALGVLIANIIGLIIISKDKKDKYDFVLVESYAALGGFLGAKILYLIVSAKDIEWGRVFSDFDYFNTILRSGFVFYGGLIGGLLSVFLAGKVHKIDLKYYVIRLIFLIPLIHGFGRIGCFCAGCCYGVPYDGPLAVCFPHGSFAIPGVKLFPVQIVEAIFLILISLIVMFISLKLKSRFTVESYLILYAILRFILENYRYDEDRGIYFGLSTSQWISIFMVVASVVSIIIRISKAKNKAA